MALDLWQERQRWRNEERRRMEDQERRRVERTYGRGWHDESERYKTRPELDYQRFGLMGPGGLWFLPRRYPEEERYARGYDRGYRQPGEPRYGGGYEERGWWERAKDEVKSWAGDEDAERRRRMDEARSHYGRGPKGYTRSDERIREDVSDRLTEDWVVDASDVDVSVSSGEVTLNGTVDSRRAKRRAEDCADSISGVRHVQNNLRVRQPAGSSAA